MTLSWLPRVVTYVQFSEKTWIKEQICNIPAKTCTVKRPCLSSILNADYYSSFIKLLMLAFIINILHKPDGCVDYWPQLSLPSCCLLRLVTTKLHASCVRVYVASPCLCLSWPHPFWTKVNRIYIDVINKRHANANAKFRKDFWKHQYLNNVYSTDDFSLSVLSIA